MDTTGDSTSWQYIINQLDNDYHNVGGTGIFDQIAQALDPTWNTKPQPTGDIIVSTYYDYDNPAYPLPPFTPAACPNFTPFLQELNQHIARDATAAGATYGTPVIVVDTYSTLGPELICSDTNWCSKAADLHPTDYGYSLLANTIETTAGY